MKSHNNKQKIAIENTFLYQKIKFKNIRVLILGLLLLLGAFLVYQGFSEYGWFTSIVVATLVLIGFYNVYLFFTRNNDMFKHPDLKKFLEFDEPNDVIMLFENEISDRNKINPYSNCLVLPNFLVKNSFFRFKVFHLHELVWVHSAVEKTSHSINFIPLGTSSEFAVKVYADNGEDIEIKCSNKKEMNNLFEDLCLGASFVIKGYSEDLENYWSREKENFISEVKEALNEYLNSKEYEKKEEVDNYRSDTFKPGDSNMTMMYIIYIGLTLVYLGYLLFKAFTFGFGSLLGETIISTILPLIGIIWITFLARRLSKIHSTKRTNVDKADLKKVWFFSLGLVVFWFMLYIPVIEEVNFEKYNETFVINENEISLYQENPQGFLDNSFLGSPFDTFNECEVKKAESYLVNSDAEWLNESSYMGDYLKVTCSIKNLENEEFYFKYKIYAGFAAYRTDDTQPIFEETALVKPNEVFKKEVTKFLVTDGYYDCEAEPLERNVCETFRKYYIPKEENIMSFNPISSYFGINVYD